MKNNNNNNKIIISLIVLILFLLSIILLFNDLMNYFIVTITVTIILFIYLCFIVFRKEDDKSIYDRELKKILKTYDSILIYSDNDYKLNNDNIIIVNDLDDLVKINSVTKRPIIFIKEEKSAVFLLNSETELLAYIKKENKNVVSKYEAKIIEYINDNKDVNNNKKILDNIDKTMLIKLKNDKVYKVSPLNKKKK